MKSNNEFHLSSKLADPSIVVASFVSLATAFLCFASKAISRSLRCSSSPNQTRLRLGFDSVFAASSKLADPVIIVSQF